MRPSEERMAAIVEKLRQAPALAGQLSGQRARLVEAALGGQSVHEIAQAEGISEEAVWDLLGDAARAAAGESPAPVESGGMGSDTVPGRSGGYGATALGSLEAEPDSGQVESDSRDS